MSRNLWLRFESARDNPARNERDERIVLEELKRGLVQDLLTGTVRVSPDSSES